MKEKIKSNPILHYGGILLIIAIVFALILAGMNLMTQDVIAERRVEERDAARARLVEKIFAPPVEAEEDEEELDYEDEEDEDVEEDGEDEEIEDEEILPPAVDYDKVIANWEFDPTVWIYIKDGEIVAYIAIASGRGYGGYIEVMVGMDKDFTIAGIEILSQSEMPWLGAKIKSESFLSQFESKVYPLHVTRRREDINESEITVLDGAFNTSKVIARTVNQAVEVAITFAENIAESMIEEAQEDEVNDESDAITPIPR
jgi:electron transport complex protein RnfG